MSSRPSLPAQSRPLVGSASERGALSPNLVTSAGQIRASTSARTFAANTSSPAMVPSYQTWTCAVGVVFDFQAALVSPLQNGDANASVWLEAPGSSPSKRSVDGSVQLPGSEGRSR